MHAVLPCLLASLLPSFLLPHLIVPFTQYRSTRFDLLKSSCWLWVKVFLPSISECKATRLLWFGPRRGPPGEFELLSECLAVVKQQMQAAVEELLWSSSTCWTQGLLSFWSTRVRTVGLADVLFISSAQGLWYKLYQLIQRIKWLLAGCHCQSRYDLLPLSATMGKGSMP